MKKIQLRRTWMALALGLGLTIAACSDEAPPPDPIQVAAQICTPDSRECAGTHTAVVCSSDGFSRISVTCGADELCDAGNCVTDPLPACTSAENGCQDASTALRCAATGKGFDVVTCPTGTNCVEGGQCQGSCIVGSSFCLDDGTVATCTDGKSFASVACGAGENCVVTGSTPIPLSACKASECQPAQDGCDAVCGNQADPGAANQDKTVSFCVETPNGYKWTSVSCPGSTSCNPSASACAGGTQAGCSADCVDGDRKCTDELNYVECAAGKWGTVATACNANPADTKYICFTQAGAATKAVCGDFVCAEGEGACDAQGMFHACGTDGRVAAAGAACATGVCQAQPSGSPGIWTKGACVDECQAGDEQCVAGSTYQTCSSGRWSAPLQCAGGKTCLGYVTTSGRPAKSCGDCIPGKHRCSDMGGAPAGSGADYLQTCDAAGAWGAATACAVGTCKQSPSNDAGCVADCYPGKKVCLGGDKTVKGTGIVGTDSEGTCGADGKLPAAPTACTGDEVCRRGPGGSDGDYTGAALGCLACVGTQNEFGLRDTRCADMNGDPGGNYVQQCKADHSAWDNANLSQCMAPNDACYDASVDTAIPQIGGPYCHTINLPIFGDIVASDTGLRAARDSNPLIWALLTSGLEPTCQAVFGQAAVSCPSGFGSVVNDCCQSFCAPDPAPAPAYCDTP